MPAVVDAKSPPVPQRRMRRGKVEAGAGTIEVEISGVTVRVGRGADAKTLMAVMRALKAGDRPDGRGPSDGGDQACRLPKVPRDW